MFTTLRQVAAIGRSLWVYHGDSARHRRMDKLYARFMRRGDLVFDIGAHVGDRIRCFRRLGCHVVALEPQASLVRVLRLLYGRADDVMILEAAAGARSGTLELHLNPANPTVATGSTGFIAAAAGSPGWEREHWTRCVTVKLTTLDALIVQHGEPAFIKIDVEGLEDAVLHGLSRAVRALSFEFTTIQRRVAVACLQRCMALGPYRFNAALGESQILVHEDWLDEAAMARWLGALPHAANSGDVYAVRADVAV
jgi:FkbM family methyltransferase